MGIVTKQNTQAHNSDIDDLTPGQTGPQGHFINDQGDLLIMKEGFRSIQTSRKFQQLRLRRVESELKQTKGRDPSRNINTSTPRVRSNTSYKR